MGGMGKGVVREMGEEGREERRRKREGEDEAELG